MNELTSAVNKSEVGSSQYSSILSVAFWRNYIITMRPYLLFVSGITGAAGLSLSGLTSASKAMLYSILFFLSYGFGQALTDCTQIDTDSISSPYRPLVRGIIRPRDVATISLIGLFCTGVILALANWINIFLSTAAVMGLSTYTFFKRRWWGGPLYNSAVVMLLCVIGYESGIGYGGSSIQNILALRFTLLAVFFGYANFVLTGYFKDVSADRATGYNTLPVIFGFRVSAIISDLLAGLAMLFSMFALYFILRHNSISKEIWFSGTFAIAGIFAAILAQIRLHKITDENDAHQAIAPVVHSYILLLSAIIMAAHPNWIIPLYYCAFLITMKFRPERSQI